MAQTLVNWSSHLVNHLRRRVVVISARILIEKRMYIAFSNVPCSDELVQFSQIQLLLLQKIFLQYSITQSNQNSVNDCNFFEIFKPTKLSLKFDRLHKLLSGFVWLLSPLTKPKPLYKVRLSKIKFKLEFCHNGSIISFI
uniref:(northern house mosquito) hypothetical protein n=2 Tax=Culex pipiens TaxID=7175 RepID=A0A8D8GDL5_CULPI